MVFKGSSYLGCFLVGVVQKLIPLMLIRKMGMMGVFGGFLELLSLVTSLKGAFSGVGVKDFRLLLGFSSLGQSG